MGTLFRRVTIERIVFFSLQSRAFKRIIVLRVGSCGSVCTGAHGYIHGERKTGLAGGLPLFFLSVIQAVYRHICLYSITKKACGKKRHRCVAVIFTLRI